MVRLFNVYYPTRAVLLLLMEAALVSLCFLAATALISGPDTYIALAYEHGWMDIAGVMVLVSVLSYYFDLYDPEALSTPVEIYFRLLLVLGFACFIVSGALFALPQIAIAPGVYPIGFALLAPVLILWRKLYEFCINFPLFRKRVYVMGCGSLARSVVKYIRERRDIGMEVIHWHGVEIDIDERKERWLRDLNIFLEGSDSVERIIVAVDDERKELPVNELLALRFQGVIVEKAGAIHERLCGKIQLDGLRPSNLLFAEGFRIKASQQFVRRVVSTCAAGLGLFLFLPLLPVVVLLVRLSSEGPILFRQTRVGIAGKTFDVIKFRTMYTNAEEGGARWASKDDPRVTRIGGFLRKTRLDEVPQLWNVLRGDMGFVGPRPERPEFVPWLEKELPFYNLRHLIRPGLSGWAQIRYQYGSTLAESREKLEYDLYYIKHMSLGLDLLIMFETIKTILRRRGAQ